MKAKVTRFKSLEIALSELEKFIRDGRHLYTGRPLAGLSGMRSREAVANWLICAVMTFSDRRPYCFTSDPQGGDGIIYDQYSEIAFPTEHVLVPRATPNETRDMEDLILNSVQAKETKGGASYSSGKTLVVFLDAGMGEWRPNVVARKLPPVGFSAVWLVSLHDISEAGGYTYAVTCLGTGGEPAFLAPSWLVRIHASFESWHVTRLQ